MEIVFATHSKGYGTHVVFTVDLVDAVSVNGYEVVSPNIGLLFKSDIENIYKDGGIHIKKAILDNIDMVRLEISSPKVLYVTSAAADRVDYDPIAFYGATIKWLNEYFRLNIPQPIYVYDRVKRAFYY
jgi:hypothetical protein